MKFDFFSGIVLYDLLLLWVLNRKSLIQGSLNWIKAKCPASDTLVSSWRIQGVGRGGGGEWGSDLTPIWDWTGWFFSMKRALFKNVIVLGTLLWSVRLCSQSSISRANGYRRSQIDKHVVVSAFSAVRWRQLGQYNLFLSTSQSSEINNETVNGKEAWNVKTVSCFILLQSNQVKRSRR